MDISFGAMLREKRRAAGVSQRELAKKIGIDFSYISKLENDRLAPPAAETIVAICEILEIPAEELLSAAGKIPDDVQKSISESKVAQEFLREAQQLELSEQEWEQMRASLRRLRGENE
jgi:transcriptional regulator with XRE-family HTH domain